MGYAIAEAARDRGADVVLIAAPTALHDPAGIEICRVTTALEMKDAVTESVNGADVLIMAAAVADYQPKPSLKKKLRKPRVK